MPKNIIIFSDGTGQVGGINFDEDRSNIYKLYRASRIGPDTQIDPSEQIAFYDAGLGSAADGGGLWGKFTRKIYNIVSQATGFGITANMIDCYAALIRLWQPGDRIFLFGFSRGAYTVRCLAGVIAYCGIPTHDREGNRLKLDVDSSKRVAAYAVKHIYQFATSRKPEYANWYQKFQLETRKRIAQRFREEHQSANPQDVNLANVYPYFIGVFDTVAALGSLRKSALLFVAFLFLASIVAGFFTLVPTGLIDSVPLGIGNSLAQYWEWKYLLLFLVAAATAYCIAAFFFTHVKWDFRVPAYPWWKQLATFHFTELWQEFYDFNLSEEVMYAKHAISIDENRKDFKRVKWGQRALKYKSRDDVGNLRFEQVWFSGNHADIGGGYAERESRLSDISLKWMLACAATVPNPLKFDRSLLRLYPDYTGMQHDEIKFGLPLAKIHSRLNWSYAHRVLAPEDGTPPKNTMMHQSVYDRFNNHNPVLHYDRELQYRPKTLSEHVDFQKGYTGENYTPQCTCCAYFVEKRFDELFNAKN